MAAMKGLKLVSITDKQFKPEEKLETLADCGVIPGASLYDIIYHLKNASFIVTDSYHGYCFSVLVNRTRGGSRFDTLAELFNIGDRFAENVSEISGNPKLHTAVDYSELGQAIVRETERCKKWLIDAIEAPKEDKNVPDGDLRKEVLSMIYEVAEEDLPLIVKLIRRLLKQS